MDDIVLSLLSRLNIVLTSISDIKGKVIPREILLDENKYNEIVPEIKSLKQYLSSSAITALQATATSKQKQPMLNTIRQLLKIYFLKMTPIRKSDGYEKNGKKKYKRFYLIEEIASKTI